MTIKPCPVCGEKPGIDGIPGGEHEIRCVNGNCESSSRVVAPTRDAAIRAWDSFSEPTDRRCGTCAHWEVDNSSDDHIRRCEGESEKFGTCMALPMVPETQNTALAESFGARCAMWDLRGAE